MTYKIGIFGSAEGSFEKITPIIQHLGKKLAKHAVIVINGAPTGLPYEIAKVAKENGAEIWGFSAATSREQQDKLTPECDNSIYNKITYIPQNYEFASNIQICRKYRNVTSTAKCDAGIIVSGRWGTLNEFTNLFDMGKVIGVLTGTGGIADELLELSKKITKESKAKVFYNESPEVLITLIIDYLEKNAI